jgi:hypothetical protein
MDEQARTEVQVNVTAHTFTVQDDALGVPKPINKGYRKASEGQFKPEPAPGSQARNDVQPNAGKEGAQHEHDYNPDADADPDPDPDPNIDHEAKASFKQDAEGDPEASFERRPKQAADKGRGSASAIQPATVPQKRLNGTVSAVSAVLSALDSSSPAMMEKIIKLQSSWKGYAVRKVNAERKAQIKV